MHVLDRGLVAPPVRLFERLQGEAIVLAERHRRLVAALAAQPFGEVWGRRERDEGRELRHLAADLLHHLLDQEVSERDACEPTLAIGDRIEYRRGRALHVEGVALDREDRLDRARDAAGERDLDEDERLVHQRRMEEGVAAAVRGIDARAQVVPVTNRVHRLVADDLLQDACRCRPVDLAQHQEAAVEPRREQVEKVAVDGRKILAMIHRVEHLLAHAHQRRGAVWR